MLNLCVMTQTKSRKNENRKKFLGIERFEKMIKKGEYLFFSFANREILHPAACSYTSL